MPNHDDVHGLTSVLRGQNPWLNDDVHGLIRSERRASMALPHGLVRFWKSASMAEP